MKRVVVLNTSILTSEGIYSYQKQSLDFIKWLIHNNNVESYIGHEATCNVLSAIVGKEIPMNRAMYSQQVGDIAIVFKLRGRLPEGKILTEEEMNEIGYDFYILKKEKEL